MNRTIQTLLALGLGVPQAVADIADLRLRIPMRQSMRSLNVAIAAALVLGEAKRQTGEWSALS